MTSADAPTESLRETVGVVVDLPIDPAPLLASLDAHAVPGVEEVVIEGVDHGGPSHGTVRRLTTVAGQLVPVTATIAHGRVTMTAPRDALRAPDAHGVRDDLRHVAHRWFGLDDDLPAVAAALGADPVVGPLVARRPDLRILGHLDGFEAAVTTVLGQQVTLGAMRTLAGRLVEAYGTPGTDGLRRFPDAATLAGADPDELRAAVRTTGARARTVVALAAACVDAPALAPGADVAEARQRLLAVPGIGPWTVDYLALRVLADRDAFPSGDLVLRRALDLPDPRAVAAAGDAWRPWRAYATVHLWTTRTLVL